MKDIDTLIRLKVGREHALIMQDYQSMILTISKLFGGDKGKPVDHYVTPTKKGGRTISLFGDNPDETEQRMRFAGLL